MHKVDTSDAKSEGSVLVQDLVHIGRHGQEPGLHMRRSRLGFSVAGCILVSLIWIACRNAGEPNPVPCGDGSQVNLGPNVGAVTEHTAKIWIRSCSPNTVAAQYKTASQSWDDNSVIQTEWVSTDPAADHTAVIHLTNLAAATRHDYRIVTRGESTNVDEGQFKTMPDQGVGSVVTFTIGSDLHLPYLRYSSIFDAVSEREPDFALLIGDTVDAEPAPWVSETPVPIPESAADYEKLYRESFSLEPFRSFLSNTPTFFSWDDHEILDDWDEGVRSPYGWARTAYEEYANSVNPPPRASGGLNYSFQAGDVEFYVLDTRTFRSPGATPDGPAKTMLGPVQKQDLLTWLLTSTSRFKLVVSSVMWNDFSIHIDLGESWPSYKTERDEILDFIRDNGIPGVVLISGDEHWAGAFKLSPWGIYEVAPGPMNWPLDATTADDPQILFKQAWTSVFGYFVVDTTVCPGELSIRIVDAENVVRFELSLSELDLMPVAQKEHAGLCP